MAAIRIGTCSWADQGLVETWYPKDAKSADARLRYYAEHFDVVEVNSSYYAIPAERNASLWAERTPAGFTFHVKAFGLMTGHMVKPEQLPPDLRPLVDRVTERGNVIPAPALRERVFRRFHTELEPLRDAGKLGAILMQYPPGFRPSEEALRDLVEAKWLLDGDEMLVEFRQKDWLSEENRDQTLEFLREHGLTYVTVDAPRVASPNVSPTVVAATGETAYVRFHGRNAGTWNVTGAASASERFDHYYGADELREWVGALRSLSTSVDRIYAMFNTNNADQGPVNAELLRDLLREEGVPAAPPPGRQSAPGQESLF